MLPELKKKRNQFKTEMDRKFYYEKKLKEFISMNEKTDEGIGRMNLEAIGDINDMMETHLNPFAAKMTVIGNLVSPETDLGTFRNVIKIQRSLRETREYFFLLKKILKKTRINREWKDIIHDFATDNVVKRVSYLNEHVLDSLIKTSRLNVYMMHLEATGKSFETEIREYVHLQWDSDEMMEYCKTVEKCIESRLSMMDADEKKEMLAERKRYEEIRRLKAERTKLVKKKENQCNKEKLQEELLPVLSRYCYNQLELVETTNKENRTYRKRIIEKVLSIGYNRECVDSVCCMAVYHTMAYKKTFSPGSVKYIKENGEFTRSITCASMYFQNMEKDEISRIKAEFMEKGYAVTEIILIKEERLLNQLHGYKEYVACGLDFDSYREAVESEFSHYHTWNRLMYAILSVVWKLESDNGNRSDFLNEIMSVRLSLNAQMHVAQKKYTACLNGGCAEDAFYLLHEISNGYRVTDIIDMKKVISLNAEFERYFLKTGGSIRSLQNDIMENYHGYMKNDSKAMQNYINHIMTAA